MDINKTKHDDLSLVSGGLIFTLTKVFRKTARAGKERMKTALALMMISWLPLCLLALYQGTLNDEITTISFYEDFLVHLRFLVIVPFLILIEKIVDRSFVLYIQNSGSLIPDEQQQDFDQFVMRLGKLTNSFLPEIVLLLTFYFLIIVNWHDLSFVGPGRNYLKDPVDNDLNLAGWYYSLISMPVYQLLLLRWLWRWCVWCYSILRISKFKLQLDPLHADQKAGLEYLNQIPLMFSFILMALSTVLSAVIAIDIVYNHGELETYIYPIAIYVFLITVILYAPLLFFMRFLIHAKTFGIFKFGNLVRKHNIDYAKKWIDGPLPDDEPLLGAMDHSSLADINGSYEPIREMIIVPVDFKMIALSFIFNIIPFTPLVFTQYSFYDLFNFILQNTLQ